MSRILLLNASGKQNGATGEILSIVRDVAACSGSGCFVDKLCLGDLDISYCEGCKACYETGECIQNDDVQVLFHAMDLADMIVICAPSYWADVPGQFKVFIDRCTVYADTNPNPIHKVLTPGKRCYAIALRTGQRPMECQHIIDCISHWCGHMGVEMAGSMYFCGIEGRDDIVRRKREIEDGCRGWFL